MIALDTKTPIRWTPPWREKEDAPPVYLFRSPSVIERESIEAELAGEHRAAAVYPFQLRGAFAAGVDALIGDAEPDEAARLKELVAQNDLPDDEQALLDAAREVLIEHYPAYRSLISQEQRREAMAPVVAFQKLCVGWQNVAAPFTRNWAGVAPDAMSQIDALELRVAGRFAYGLGYAAHQSGNSAAPSSSASAPATSSSAPKKPAAGKSQARSGSATRS